MARNTTVGFSSGVSRGKKNWQVRSLGANIYRNKQWSNVRREAQLGRKKWQNDASKLLPIHSYLFYLLFFFQYSFRAFVIFSPFFSSWFRLKNDLMVFQGYALCVLDYDFLILDNAFLVHRPGIKVYKKDPRRDSLTAKTNMLIKKIIVPELKVIYGTRKDCAV